MTIMPTRKKASARKKSGKKPLVTQVLTDNGMLIKRKRTKKRK
jgi:hypothetical protein